jgi:hypothetical protein
MNELVISIAVNCVLGVILLAVLLWKRVSDTERLAGAEDATRKFVHHFPDAVGVASVTDDQRGALLDLQHGHVGLLQRQGRRWNARMLVSQDIASARMKSDGTLHLKFTDFAWPSARIRFADADSRALWLKRLTPKKSAAAPGMGLHDA